MKWIWVVGLLSGAIPFHVWAKEKPVLCADLPASADQGTRGFLALMRNGVEQGLIGIPDLDRVLSSTAPISPFPSGSLRPELRGMQVVAGVLLAKGGLDWPEFQAEARRQRESLLASEERRKGTQKKTADRLELRLEKTVGTSVNLAHDSNRSAVFEFGHKAFALIQGAEKKDGFHLFDLVARRKVRTFSFKSGGNLGDLRISQGTGRVMGVTTETVSHPDAPLTSKQGKRYLILFGALTGDIFARFFIDARYGESIEVFEDETESVAIVGALGKLGVVFLRDAKPRLRWIIGEPGVDYENEVTVMQKPSFARIVRGPDGDLLAIVMLKQKERPVSEFAVFNLSQQKLMRHFDAPEHLSFPFALVPQPDRLLLLVQGVRHWDSRKDSPIPLYTIDVKTGGIVGTGKVPIGEESPEDDPILFSYLAKQRFFLPLRETTASGTIGEDGSISLDPLHAKFPTRLGTRANGAYVFEYEGAPYVLQELDSDGGLVISDPLTGRAIGGASYQDGKSLTPLVYRRGGELRVLAVRRRQLLYFSARGGK